MKKSIKLILLITFYVIKIEGQPVTDSLIAYYPFENGSLLDEYSNNTNGTAVGDIFSIVDRNGVENAAIKFSASSEILLLGLLSNYFTTEGVYSISFWYKDYSINENDYEIILTKDGSGIPEEPNSLSFGIFSENKMVFNQCVQMTDATNSNQWNHVVLTYDNGKREMYLNCNLENTSESDLWESNSGVIILGAQKYQGALDDLIFYEKVLTHEEVNLLYGQACLTSSDGIKLEESSKLKIFPNPASDIIHVEIDKPDCFLELMGANGKVYWKKMNSEDKIETISLDKLAKGLYFILIKNKNNEVQQSKIVIKQ